MSKTNIDRFRVEETNIIETLTGKIIYKSDLSNNEIQTHCDILNGKRVPYWINEEHLMWVPINLNDKFR